MHSLKRASRRLLHAPSFSIAAALTLALGIGASTAVFSVVDGVLLRPLPFPRSERLVDLSHTLAISGLIQVDQSDATYLYYRRANRAFTDVAAYRTTGVNLGRTSGTTGGDAGRAQRLSAAKVTASTFGVLGSRPIQGRVFGEADDTPNGPPVVLIGERLWRRSFGADPSIVGRRVEIDGVPREVIGVMPSRFRFPAADIEVWVPIGMDPTNTKSAAFDYKGVARLRDGVS